MSKRTNKPETTAAEAYAHRRADIGCLLDALKMELAHHDERAKAKPADWGFAGNLGHVRDDLINLVAFVAGMGREEVEALLTN